METPKTSFELAVLILGKYATLDTSNPKRPFLVKDIDDAKQAIDQFIADLRGTWIKEATERIEDEKVDAEETETEGDIAYNAAIDCAVGVIKELKK